MLLFLILSHLLVLIFQVKAGSREQRWTDVRDFKLDFLDGVITTLYAIEMLLKILCLGFCKGPYSYLRNPYNRLDFAIVIDSWVHIIVRSITGRDYFARLAVLRAFRGLLALKHIHFFADVIAIMVAVERSVRPLQNVILLTFFMLVFYALLGTQFLQKTLSQRCLRSQDKQLSYPERFCDKKVVDGYSCPSTQKCLKYGNPNYGQTSFDYLWYSLISMFQIVSLEGWSLIMYRVKDAEGERANSYFMTLVIIGTYFLCNVFIAGISGVFLRVRAEHQALLKKSRKSTTSFYSATVMANILRDDIITDDRHLKWHLRFLNRSRRIKRSVGRIFSRTHSTFRDTFHTSSMRFSRLGSRTYQRSLSGRGGRAALSVSEKCRAVVQHPSFDRGVLLAVTVNAIILCLYRYGMSKEFLYTLYGIQAVLLVLFAAELLLRFLAYGPISFMADRMNLFDLFVIAVSSGALISRAYPNISAVRIMRWFYLSKKHVDKHSSVVATCIKSVGSLVGVFFFYLLVIVIFSIVSMELYSGQYYKFTDGYPRGHHDNMLQTMLLWFSVTTAESWPNQMWNSMRPGVEYNGVAPFLYIFYFVLTVHIIMNLIIAVILEHNELTDNEKKKIQRTEHMRMFKRMQNRASTGRGSWVMNAFERVKAGFHSRRGRQIDGNLELGYDNTSLLPGAASEPAESARDGSEAVSTAAVGENITETERPQRISRGSQILQASGFPADIGEKRGSRTALQDAVLTLADITRPPFKVSSKLARNLDRRRKKESFQLSDYEALEESFPTLERQRSFLGEEGRATGFCKMVLNSRWWRWFSIAWVAISTWLVIEMRATGEPVFADTAIKVLHKLVFVVFLLEFSLRVFVQGFVSSPSAVFNDPYNILELSLLIIDALNLATWSENSRRAIHALTALRPFRFICRFGELKSLMSNLVKTVPAIVAVLLFTFLIFVVFGSIGVQLFRGLLYSCNDATITHRAYCTGHYYNNIGIYVPRAWTNPTFHFDSIGNAFLSLFVCSTFDNWVTNWLYPVMDIVGENKQPQRDNSPAYAIFFVAFCICGGFFIVRVFIGVFINEFGKNSGSKLLTERQKLWRDMNRIIQKLEPSKLPRPPKNYVRQLCFYAIRNRHYQNSMIICLLGYAALLSTNYAGQPAYVSMRRQKAHVALTTYFLLESLIKFLGDEFEVYKYEHSKHMEAAISILAASGLMGKKGTPRGYVCRFAYIARVFCIIPHVPRARVIMRTMVICLPTMGEIMVLLGVFLFAFSGIGFQMFSHVAEGTCIGPTLNFRTFVNSFITVFQVSTLDNWSCIMVDVMVDSPKCTKGDSLARNDCGHPFAGVIYFVCLVVISSFIFMNLFVALILDAITFGLVNENSMVSPEHLLAFKALWAQQPFDPEASGYIGMHKLRNFVNALGVPLGRRHNSTVQWYLRIEFEVMSFRVPNKGIPFKQLLETFTLYKIGPTGLPLTLRIEREKQIQSVYIRGAATKIEALVRGFLVRRRFARGSEGQNQEQEQQNSKEAQAATKMQALARGFIARRKAAKASRGSFQKHEREETAAKKIQAFVRGKLAKERAATGGMEKLEEVEAATKIQAVARGFLARKKAARQKHEQEQAHKAQELEVIAARKIQVATRRYLLRLQVRQEQKHADYGASGIRIQATPWQNHIAATKIQRAARFVAKRTIQQVEQHEEPSRVTAATRIQAAARGFLARRKALRVKMEHSVGKPTASS
ncbi:sodium channel protein type 3 subunit alpha isoform X2 [Selaginella moellendorffii]|nr:sodium channel protein type 3 subunit alpha isoform X2 [Selaginella moellendorffii]|eukprot:XP_024517811.1 sodium channel protein type 3 subunit alpha isoform X2 [Selaginella moellendorffii]